MDGHRRLPAAGHGSAGVAPATGEERGRAAWHRHGQGTVGPAAPPNASGHDEASTTTMATTSGARPPRDPVARCGLDDRPSVRHRRRAPGPRRRRHARGVAARRARSAARGPPGNQARHPGGRAGRVRRVRASVEPRGVSSRMSRELPGHGVRHGPVGRSGPGSGVTTGWRGTGAVGVAGRPARRRSWARPERPRCRHHPGYRSASCSSSSGAMSTARAFDPSEGPTTPRRSRRSMSRPALEKPTRSLRCNIDVDPS